MHESPAFEGEQFSNELRRQIAATEPQGQRTLTPTRAVFEKAAGIYLWTPDGRKLADFTSGVLVSNLGHHPKSWLRQFRQYLGWNDRDIDSSTDRFVSMMPWTTYNAISPLEAEANRRLLANMNTTPFGRRMEKILWAASGSEAIQKALWACLKFTRDRSIIVATRDGFHGKKGLSGAVTGNEQSPDRDPRVRFVSFPKEACQDVSLREQPFDVRPYEEEFERQWNECHKSVSCFITEPYLGGAGSYHPPHDYLIAVQNFCREHEILFVLDEVQSNFGRTGEMFAFEKYGIEPDLVVLGKGLGNGVPVNCVVGRADVLESLAIGEASDTWSHNPLGCAAVLATLDVFEGIVSIPLAGAPSEQSVGHNILDHVRAISPLMEKGLQKLKRLSVVKHVRGEGMVWGVELADYSGRSSHEIAMQCVRSAYLGDESGRAIHILGPLSKNVLRIAPPLIMIASEVEEYLATLYRCVERAMNP